MLALLEDHPDMNGLETSPPEDLAADQPDSQDWARRFAAEVYEDVKDESGARDRQADSTLPRGATSLVSLVDQQMERHYEVYVPKNRDDATPLPVIMMLHGTTVGKDNGELAEVSRMNALADKYGFVVVYPLAHPRPVYGGFVDVSSWNAPGVNILAPDDRYNDVQFLDRVLDDLSGRVNVEPSRVSAIGHSAGAALIEKYQLEHPGRLSAIASISGTILDDKMQAPERHKANAGVPVLIIHGGKDMVLPYTGGSRIAWLGIGVFDGADKSKPDQQKKLWSRLNDCDGTPRVTHSNNVIVSTFKNCAAPVMEYRIADHGHAYPRTINYSRRSSVDTSELVAEFLLSHRLESRSDDSK